MVKKLKVAKSFFKTFPLYVFTIVFFFFHVYPLHALIYGLNFILEFKKLEVLKKFILIKMAPSDIHSFNFGSS
jgi:hypothetical protein